MTGTQITKMTRNEIKELYFSWLTNIVCVNRFADQISYEKLLRRLHSTRFTCMIRKDRNRQADGIDLRYRFAIANNCDDDEIEDIMRALKGPCSVLEMMVALAIRCEETIMDDTSVGNRTGQWFWGMVVSLGLGGMMNHCYNDDVVDEAIDTFLHREYAPNGKGGLFTIRNCDRDLRKVEIWTQLCWYLDSIA